MTGIRDRLKARTNELIHADGGATATEYALLSALIAVALVSVVAALGSSLTGAYTNVSAAMDLTQSGDAGDTGKGNNGNGKGGNGRGNNGAGNGNGGPNGGG